MIWFNVREALEQLEQKGEVYTLRPLPKREGRHPAFSTLRRQKYLGIVEVKFIQRIDKPEELTPYLNKSGFSTIYDWWSAAEGSRYLHYVKMVRQTPITEFFKSPWAVHRLPILGWSQVLQTPAEVWLEAEKFLREHGYVIDKSVMDMLLPDWEWIVQKEYLEEGKFRDAVAFVIHEAVEFEELKRIVGYWINPRDYDMKCLKLKDIREYKECMDKHMEAHYKAEEMEKKYLQCVTKKKE